MHSISPSGLQAGSDSICCEFPGVLTFVGLNGVNPINIPLRICRKVSLDGLCPDKVSDRKIRSEPCRRFLFCRTEQVVAVLDYAISFEANL
jgi:hypothetical protein